MLLLNVVESLVAYIDQRLLMMLVFLTHTQRDLEMKGEERMNLGFSQFASYLSFYNRWP